MARNEQVRIDLTAKDDASKVIDKVADKVEGLEDEKVDIPIDADTDKATRAVENLSDDVKALSRQDAEIVLRAKVDAAKADLKALRGDLEQTGDKAEDTARQLDRVGGDGGGISTRGNAIADLTGPLGDASSAASDFAGVFDGLGDIAGDVATKLGASTRVAGAVAGAMGGLGIVVAAGAAAWTLWRQRADDARRKAEETRKAIQGINEAIAEGDYAKAGADLKNMFGDFISAGTEAGLSVRQVTDYITGFGDSLNPIQSKIDAARDALAAIPDDVPRALQPGMLDPATQNWLALGAALDDARGKFITTKNATDAEKAAVDVLAQALGLSYGATKKQTGANEGLVTSTDSVKDALDRVRDALDVERAAEDFTAAISAAMMAARDDSAETVPDIRAVENAILNAGETGRLNPIQVKSLIEALDTQDLEDIKFLAEDFFRRNPVGIVSRVIRPPLSSFGGNRPEEIVGGTAASVVNVTQVLPRGYRERDTLTAARDAAARSGGLYRGAQR